MSVPYFRQALTGLSAPSSNKLKQICKLCCQAHIRVEPALNDFGSSDILETHASRALQQTKSSHGFVEAASHWRYAGMQAVEASSGTLRAIVRELQEVVAAYTELALVEVPKQEQASATIPKCAPTFARRVEGRRHVPVLSAPVAAQADGGYEELPYVAKVLPGIRYLGGQSAPKLIGVQDNFAKVRVLQLSRLVLAFRDACRPIHRCVHVHACMCNCRHASIPFVAPASVHIAMYWFLVSPVSSNSATTRRCSATATSPRATTTCGRTW